MTIRPRARCHALFFMALPLALPLALLAMLAPPMRPASGQVAEGDPESDEERNLLRSWGASIRRGQLGRETSEFLDEYLVDVPASAFARALRATLHRRRGRYEDAALDLAAAEAELSKAGPDGGRSTAADLETRLAVAIAGYELARERGELEAAAAALERGLAATTGVASAMARSLAPLLSRQIELLAQSGRRADASRRFAEAMKDQIDAAEDPAYVLEYGRALAALRQSSRAAQVLVPLEKFLREQDDPAHAECLFLLGRVYRVAHSGGDALPAVAALKDALRIDRQLIPAQVELARARLFRFESGDAEAAIGEAMGVHERHADAWAVRGEILLLDQRAEEGLQAVERGLTENPRHLAALSVKAAALWILGRKPDAQQVLSRLVELAPDDGEHVGRIADVLAYLYRFREAIPIYRRALQCDPDWGYSWVGMARCMVNTGDLDGALDALNRFRKVDRVPFALADNVAKALQKLRTFIEVPRGRFTYVMHPLEAPVLVPLLDEAYGRAWPDLCRRWEFDPQTPVRIECFPKHDDFSARTVGFTGFGALGVCFGNVFTLLSPRSEMRGQFVFDKTAVHELAHVVTLGLSKNKVPRWLTEGISVHEEHVYAKNSDREMDLDLFNYFRSGEIVPVRELNRIFGGPKILFGYYQGGLLCDFLVEQRGEGVLVEMLKEFGKDGETPAVVQSVLGLSCEALDSQFLDWLDRTRIRAMKVQPTYTPDGRRRLLDRLRATEEPEAELLAQVAWAYHAANRPVDRDDFLQQALRRDERLPAARFLMAERALQGRRTDEALKELEAGMAAGGLEFFALLRYAQLESARAGVTGRRVAARDPHGDGEGALPAAPDLADAERAARERLLELYARAKSCFPRFVGDQNPYLMRARLFRELGRDDEAFAELAAFCAINESDVPARVLLAERSLELADYAAARGWLRELRMIDPFKRQTWRDLARCERELREPARAIELLEVALQIDPSTEQDYDPARFTGDEAAKAKAEEAAIRAELLLDLVDVRLAVGERESARVAFEEARTLSPADERLKRLGAEFER
jgi:tetratricopeptide (TPR) repeat protein